MSRPLRLEFAWALCHVTSRGDRQEDIFLDDSDRASFLQACAEVSDQCNWTFHAYCLMGNHYHLLLETPDGNLAKGMRQLNGVYTQRFNRKHAHMGHLFQGRNQPAVWEQLKNQIYPGTDAFVEKMQTKVLPDADLSEVPSAQRRAMAQPLAHYATHSPSKDAAIAKAHSSGSYSLKEIGEHFGLHYSPVSHIVSQQRKSEER